MSFKKVNAIYKCFDILDLLINGRAPLGISEISETTGINKSTVFNIVHTLVDLAVLNKTNNKYCIGPKIYLLGKSIDYEYLLVGRIRHYLQEFAESTKLTVSLGIRSGLNIMVLERIIVSGGIDLHNKNNIRPLLEGVHGPAIMSILSETEEKSILKNSHLQKHTSKTITDKKEYSEKIAKARKTGVALDRGEYHEGILAVCVPINIEYLGVQAAIWGFGMGSRINEKTLNAYAQQLKQVAVLIDKEFNTKGTDR